MKPVNQTLHGEVGNCFAACLASLLELPISEVPNLAVDGLPPFDPDDHLRWARAFYQNVNRWLEPRGLFYFEVGSHGGVPQEIWEAIPPDGYWIGIDPEYGPHGHAVVMQGREMVHDPHPSRAGVREIWSVGLLIPLDPARTRA